MSQSDIISGNPDAITRWELAIADPVIQYILVRSDMPDFHWGRTCAQVVHCGTQMTEDKNSKQFPDLDALYYEWQCDPERELAAEQAILRESEAHAGVKDPDTTVQAAKDLSYEAAVAARAARRTFGTCLTLAVTAAEMRQAVSLAQLLGLHAGITHDPTYPIFVKDGDRTQVVTMPVDSCAYVFGRKSSCAPVLGRFDLLSEKHIL